MIRPAVVAAFVILLCLAAPALAWNKPGHMIVGAIAYDVLKKDQPATLARVLDALRAHPDYADDFDKRLETVDPQDRDRYLFQIAARWADDIRDDRNQSHPVWHYVDFPYVVQVRGREPVKGADPGPQNAITAMRVNLDELRGRGTAADKAIALTWIFHLVGDLHQPLHCVSLYSPDYPRGDRGGNLAYVRVTENRAVIDLHSLWDGLLTRSQRSPDTSKIATELFKRPDFDPKKLTGVRVTNPQTWAKESFDLAVAVAYDKGTVTGNPDRGAAPLLPDGYTTTAKATAERQVVLAGYRLAAVLVDAFGTKRKP